MEDFQERKADDWRGLSIGPANLYEARFGLARKISKASLVCNRSIAAGLGSPMLR